MPERTRVALVGIDGFGVVHRANLARLADRADFVAAVDVVAPEPGTLADNVRVYTTLDELLAAVAVDVVIIATPTNTHAGLAEAAMRAGADVYLEKPTAASLDQFDALVLTQRETGRAVQVGFQSLGSHALGPLMDGSLVGEIQAVGATGAWLRPLRYWSRAPWAGRRTLNGEDVVDGVVTNLLAHAVATALVIAGACDRSSVERIDLDLYRANDIEVDDTSVVRIVTATGPTVTAALTLDAEVQTEPVIIVRGSRATAEFHYTLDQVTIDGVTTEYGRTDLFENLLDHRDDGSELLSPLENTGAFMRVLDDVRVAEPHPIASEYIDWRGEGDAAHPVVQDVEAWMARAVDAQATFSELGAPWAAPRRDSAIGTLQIDDEPVATYLDGAAITASSSPRPYLHPIHTRAGVTVTDHHPADHDWHFGLSVAVQDVDGTNFWGGRTYVRDRGYTWRDDHGCIVSRHPRVSPTSITDVLSWLAPDGSELLQQQFDLTARAVDVGWVFDLSFDLRGSRAVSLGSPGSNGRVGGGYGGLTWRIAECSNVHVRTPFASGEQAVHGTVAPWVAWSADFAEGPATIALASSTTDPWFVRVDAYPGLGSSLAWDTPAVTPVARTFRGLVADGRLSDAQVAAALVESTA
ncbi:MAG: DUF6807 family protein [Rhodoglobus sp.]